MARFSPAAIAKIRNQVRKGESQKHDRIPPGAGGSGSYPSSDDDPRIVITTEPIEPNEWGKFRFTRGAKGSEVADGPEYDGFYRNEEEGDQPTMPTGTKCLVLWIASSEPSESPCELFPLKCITDDE